MLILLAALVCWVYNGHNAGTRPAGKPASKTSKPEQPSSRAASKTSILLFLTGFRNYVRGFLGALLELLRVQYRCDFEKRTIPSSKSPWQ
jgi:hypothetical protein